MGGKKVQNHSVLTLGIAHGGEVLSASKAAVKNVKAAVDAMKVEQMGRYLFYFGSKSRRNDLSAKVSILRSHKAHYKARRRRRRAEHGYLLTEAPRDPLNERTLNQLRKLDSDIQELMRRQWYNNSKNNRDKLKEKKVELAKRLHKMNDRQRIQWLLEL